MSSDLEYLEYLGVVPVAKMLGSDPGDTFELKALYSNAEELERRLGFIEENVLPIMPVPRFEPA